MTGDGLSYKERHREQIHCPDCRKELARVHFMCTAKLITAWPNEVQGRRETGKADATSPGRSG